MCDGKSFCRVEPTDKFFGYGVKCGGWKRMWITYSCDGGDDDTTKGITELACPADRGVMKNADIPLEGGWINILCSARANRNPRKPCIFIHKVRAGCGWGAPIAEHMKLVSWKTVTYWPYSLDMLIKKGGNIFFRRLQMPKLFC